MSDEFPLARVAPGSVVLTREEQLAQGLELGRAQHRAWQAERELAKANEQRDRLGDRLHQLEELLASHFARSVKMLSGSRRQLGESQDAARAVDALEDHLKALRLLNSSGVECDRVEHGVRRLLDLRDRVVNEPPAQPTIVEVMVQPEVYEVAGDYSLVGGVPALPSKTKDRT